MRLGGGVKVAAARHSATMAGTGAAAGGALAGGPARPLVLEVGKVAGGVGGIGGHQPLLWAGELVQHGYRRGGTGGGGHGVWVRGMGPGRVC